MKAFFKQQLKTIHLRTGIRQLETLMQKPNWQEEANTLIDLMVSECGKPPFDLVHQTVKERVITDAIITDEDFIGLNQKFVRKALNKFWATYGGKILESMNRKEDSPPIEHTEEQKARIDAYAKEFLENLEKIGAPKKDYTYYEERKAAKFVKEPTEHKSVYDTLESLEQREERLRGYSERTYRERHPEASEEKVQEFMKTVPSTLDWQKKYMKPPLGDVSYTK